MVTLSRRAARTPLAPVVAIMFALVAAILVAAVPDWMFNQAVLDSHLPSILPYAAPPLGLIARILAVTLALVGTGAVLWMILTPLEKLVKRAKVDRSSWRDTGYATADDTVKIEARRRPIFAPSELGAPLMSDEAIATPVIVEAEAEAEAPAEAPAEAEAEDEDVTADAPTFQAEPDLAVLLSAAEFDLPPSDDPRDEDNSIQSLIRRLEAGLARKAANDPGPDAPNSAHSPLSLSSDWIVSDGEVPTPSDGKGGNDMRQALGTLKRFASR